ncbi:MAG: ABC transporter ATP-binding protein/permease [Firmicutes bacterium]|nr:ABC transporter ATP-binding protein/permease [Bacillota bacterium]NBI64000.1 ATP-binding cassette domain-containing protein [Clostridiales bacterium]
MVKLEHVNKYFNKRKKNEIHVIHDTSLEMASSGLVALLGPSGCGKTTLLNAIGGLDKVNSGQIFVNGQRITKRRSGKIDQIRNLNVGYIFQNYNLVDNMTVFDNVALALKMVGVKDKKEIRDKVHYVLEKVGMYRYRNRYADMLSGGERQRVGIARAIVKDPAIVIADEPTGNLDSKNTLEVMNIIRSISQNKLVILVTHEEKLADFYASRIIRIKDGKVVSDEENDHAAHLDYRLESKIYLKDIKDHKRLKTDLYNIDFYNDSSAPIGLDIVVRNGNIYIQAKGETDRMELVGEDSSIELVDDHYRKMTKEESLENSFDRKKLKARGHRRYTSILNPFAMVKRGFKTVFNYPILKKILLIGFLISAMFITYAVSNIFGVLDITDDEFVTADKSYLTIVSKHSDVKDYLKYEKSGNFQYIMPGDAKIMLAMPYKDYYQLQGQSAALGGCLSDYEKLKTSDLKYGRLPENPQEIVIDAMILKSAIKESGTKMAGFGTQKSFLNQAVSVPNMPDMKIVGITDLQSPCIYGDQSIFINLLANATGDSEGVSEDRETEGETTLLDYHLKEKDVTLKSGAWPKKPYEVVVNESHKEEMPLGKEIAEKVNGHKLKVTGYYTDKDNSDFLLVSNETIKYNLIKTRSDITACPVDKEAAISQLQNAKVNVKDIYAESKEAYEKEIFQSMRSALIMAGVVLAVSFIEIFLIIRASFLSRVKEVGVYRAIGVKKGDIYKMFLGEILAITTMASVPGYLFMAYIMNKLSGYDIFSNMFLVNLPVMVLCAALLYGFNLVFGLLPVFRTMRKRPAAILSRTDIN